MTTTTNLNVAPYFDDYDQEKNFHRVLFQPGVPVQARELTQLQTILQNQVERFGDNIYQTGTVIRGCSFNFDPSVKYVKIRDLHVDGQDVNINMFSNTYVKDSTGLLADVIAVSSGLESQTPDLNTLHIKYLNVGSFVGAETKAFTPGAILTSYRKDYSLLSIEVDAGGTLYSNSDVVVITPVNGGTGATASIVTNSSGQIRNVLLLNAGSGYLEAPTVTVTTSTGSGASLRAVNYVAQLTIANNSFASPIGNSYVATVSEGIVYQKGFFVRVDPQLTVVSKYTNKPTSTALGFDTIESIVNSSIDTTLLDNSLGSTNFQAPGANRLKLTPVLKVVTKTEAAGNTQFLSIIEFENGQVTRNRSETQFNSINSELSRRTYEESGNYVVKTFPLSTESISGNTTHLRAVVGAGVGYVEGHRVEQFNDTRIPIRKATDEKTVESQTISTNYGDYVFVKEFAGLHNVKTGARVSLRDTAGTSISTNAGGVIASPGAEIGSAYVRAITYDSGTPGTPEATYRVYLFNVTMNTGKNFKSVRSIRSDVSGEALADVVLVGGEAVIQDARFESLVFRSGVQAVKNFNNEQFIYTTSSNTSLATGGTFTINLTGTDETWPYTAGSTLNNIQERDFIIVPATLAISSVNKTGTVTTTGANTVTGAGTLFTSEYVIGQYIRVGTNTPARITSISNNTFLNVATNVPAAAANVHTVAYPAGVPINAAATATIAIDGTGKIATFNLGHAITGATNVNVIHNVKVNNAAAKTKTLVNDVYVKLSTTAVASNLNGGWTLGHPDVYRITGVWVGTANTYSNTSTNVMSSFTLDNGQRDSFYGLAKLNRKPGAPVSLSNTNCLLVRMDLFTHSAGLYCSTESYPVDDVTTVLPANKIRSQFIPVYKSVATGNSIDLRDSVDFRPIVANTAVASTTVAGASIDPADTFSIGTTNKYFPSPTGSFQADVLSYLPRKDLIIIDTYGRSSIVEGTPASNPVAPLTPRGAMALGTIHVPPYPSLSAKEASDAGRPDYAALMSPTQQKGYTMSDIQGIENRLSRLEYYTLLNTIEQSTKNLTIPSSANSSFERFKNGFFVDSFNDYSIADIENDEFRSLIDPSASTLRPLQEQTNIYLKYNAANSTNATLKGDYALPNYSNTVALEQLIATKQRTLVDKFWSFNGRAAVTPAFDNYFDVDVKPVNVSIDVASPLTSLAAAVNEALAGSTAVVTQSTVRSEPTVVGVNTTTQGWWTRSTSSIVQDIATTVTTTAQQLTGGVPTTATQQVGDFLTDISIRPYIRPQQLTVSVTGLRPGAKHFVFFDKQPVSSMCAPVVVTDLTNAGTSIKKSSAIRTGDFGADLVASSGGVLNFVLNIPAGTFFVGEREIFVMDFNDINSIESATSTAKTRFVAYNFGGQASSVSVSTRSVTPFVLGTTSNSVTTTTRNSFERTVVTVDETVEFGGGGGDDPISQTFKLKAIGGADGFFITSVDVWFAAKDANLGVNVELREVNAGYPSASAIPNSRAWLPSSSVNTSATAATATTFTFQTPVYIKADTEYALVVYPDGMSPDYRIWTAKVGEADVSNSSITNNKNWGNGTLFYSTNGSSWTAVQDEDMKFRIRTANFLSSTANVAFTNDDYEFLTVALSTANSFIGGERVAQLGTSYSNGVVTTTTNSATLTGNSTFFTNLVVGDSLTLVYGSNAAMSNAYFSVSGTVVSNSFGTATLTSEFVPGEFVRFGNTTVGEIRQVIAVTNASSMVIDAAPIVAVANSRIYKVNASFDVVKVATIANNTSLTMDKFGRANAVATFQKSVSGVAEQYKTGSTKLVLNESNAANSTFRFQTSNSSYRATLIGAVSQSVASVSSINNVDVSFFSPLINRLVLPGTKTDLIVGSRRISSNTVAFGNYQFGEKSKVAFDSNVLSKTNEILNNGGNKSLVVTVPLATDYSVIAPVVDIAPASLLTLKSLINNDATGESTRYGNATSKYVSKRIVLAEGLDAEDAMVYLTAHKPVGTEIKVYAKVLNSSDPESFDSKSWTEMVQKTAPTFSSSIDERDRREFVYVLPSKPDTGNDLAGFAAGDTSSTTLTGSSSTWNVDLAAGDYIQIIRTSDTTDYDVRRVVGTPVAGSLTLNEPLSFTASGLVVRKLTNPNQVFKFAPAGGVARYNNGSGAVFETYKYMAIKIVLLSPYTYLTPVIDDVRALCVSV